MKENTDEAKVHQVDDSFFKKLFTSQKNARDFLVTVLPEKIKEQSDLSKVRIDLTSYVSNELRKGFSDIVLKARVNTKKGKKKHVDIYFILDHKTRGKREMFIQFLKYKVYQWEKDLINKRPLRVIIPVVFYHGKSKWKIPDRFADQFDVHDDIKQYLLDFKYVLFDTDKWEFRDEKYHDVRKNVFMFSGMVLMKTAYKNDFETIREIMELWHKKGFTKDKETLKIFLLYITQTQEIKLTKLEKMLEDSKINGGEVMQTLAQELENKGILIGEERGKENQKIETARRMLADGLPIETISKYTGLSTKTINELRKKGKGETGY